MFGSCFVSPPPHLSVEVFRKLEKELLWSTIIGKDGNKTVNCQITETLLWRPLGILSPIVETPRPSMLKIHTGLHNRVSVFNWGVHKTVLVNFNETYHP